MAAAVPQGALLLHFLRPIDRMEFKFWELGLLRFVQALYTEMGAILSDWPRCNADRYDARVIFEELPSGVSSLAVCALTRLGRPALFRATVVLERILQREATTIALLPVDELHLQHGVSTPHNCTLCKASSLSHTAGQQAYGRPLLRPG